MGDAFLGCTVEDREPKMAGGGDDDQKLGGTKMMGVQLDGGPNDGLHCGPWGTQNGGGPPIGAEPKWRQAENGVKKPKFGAFVSFFSQERGENSGQPAMISKNKPQNCPKFDKFTLKMNPKIAQNLINLP